MFRRWLTVISALIIFCQLVGCTRTTQVTEDDLPGVDTPIVLEGQKGKFIQSDMYQAQEIVSDLAIKRNISEEEVSKLLDSANDNAQTFYQVWTVRTPDKVNVIVLVKIEVLEDKVNVLKVLSTELTTKENSFKGVVDVTFTEQGQITYHIKGQLFNKGITAIKSDEVLNKTQSVHLENDVIEGDKVKDIDILDTVIAKHK